VANFNIAVHLLGGAMRSYACHELTVLNLAQVCVFMKGRGKAIEVPKKFQAFDPENEAARKALENAEAVESSS
jgi:hypothetical protein